MRNGRDADLPLPHSKVLLGGSKVLLGGSKVLLGGVKVLLGGGSKSVDPEERHRC